MMSPEAAITETLRQQSFDDQESQKSLEVKKERDFNLFL